MPHDEVHVRRTDPWMWVAIVAIAALLVLLIVWLVAARSPEEQQRQVQQPPEMPTTEQAREPEEQNRVVIRDREQVREIVRERPVYVYVERPEEGAQTQAPREVVVVPQDSSQPGTDYERVDLPARFSLNGKEWIIQPGRPIKSTAGEFVAAGKRVDDHVVYYQAGATEPFDAIFLRLRPDSNIYVRYEPAEE